MIDLKNINLDIFDTIGDGIVKASSHLKKDIKIVSQFSKHSLASALKFAGSSNTDAIKKAFIQSLVMAAAANYGQAMTPDQAALISNALVKGLDEITTKAGNVLEK